MHEMFAWYIDNNAYISRAFVDQLLADKDAADAQGLSILDIRKNRKPEEGNSSSPTTAARNAGLLDKNDEYSDALRLYKAGIYPFPTLMFDLVAKRNVAKSEEIPIKPLVCLCKVFSLMQKLDIPPAEHFITTAEVYEYLSVLEDYKELTADVVERMVSNRVYSGKKHIPDKRVSVEHGVYLSSIFSIMSDTTVFSTGLLKSILHYEEKYIELVNYIATEGDRISNAPVAQGHDNSKFYNYCMDIRNGIMEIIPALPLKEGVEFPKKATKDVFEYLFGVQGARRIRWDNYFTEDCAGIYRIFFPVLWIPLVKVYLQNKEIGELLLDYAMQANQYIDSLKEGKLMIELPFENTEHTDISELTTGEGGGYNGELTVKEAIDHIKEYIAAKGFSYKDGLIENFYLSLKSKPFVILAGTSGTGKTRLVKLFAEAMGANRDNKRYMLVPVRPDWSDSSDLFGHVDLNGKFAPGAIIDFVKQAEEDSENPYFLCLDEMNLARVEYYLSDILSVIETREFVGGKIETAPLVSAKYYGKDEEAKAKYGEIPLPENLYIIGTVNMDETTFPFSRKVLDRANTIEFSYVDLVAEEQPSNQGSPQVLNLPNSFLKTEYLQLQQCLGEEGVKACCEELQAVNQILQRAEAHVGYRVRDEIVFYCLNNKKHGLIPDTTAMDNELMQKVLPRIQGSSASIKNMLCELFKHCAGDYDGYQVQSDNISDKMKKALSDETQVKYRRSAEKIELMTRRFEEDGFTSYWL